MNWNDLQYFVCLVNLQTLTATAEKLDVQHTTVARRIATLEQTLNIRLFDRVGKRYTLTEAGERLYEQACGVEDCVHTLQRMAINQTRLQGTVTLSAPPVLANEVLTPHLPDFHEQYPEICLNIQGEVRRSNLYQREADLALRLNRPSDADLVIRKLGDIHYHFYAQVDYWQHVQTQHQDWQWVEFHANHRLQVWFQSIKQQRQAPTTFITNDLYLAKSAIKRQLGIGTLPAMLAQDDTELIAINPLSGETLITSNKNTFCTSTVNTQELYLVMHEDVRRAAKIRAVADWLTSFQVELDERSLTRTSNDNTTQK